MYIVDLDQNSDAWLEWRHTGLGSSDAAAAIGQSRYKTRHDLWEEKVLRYHTAHPPMTKAHIQAVRAKIARQEASNTTAKDRGKKLEPVARDAYERFMGYKIPAVCGVHDTLPFLKVSLDGYNPDRQLFAEIKAIKQEFHDEAIDRIIPNLYAPQLLHQFATTGLRKCHYISYHDTNPPGQRLVIVNVDANTAKTTLRSQYSLDEQVAAMTYALTEFWNCVVSAEYKELDF